MKKSILILVVFFLTACATTAPSTSPPTLPPTATTAPAPTFTITPSPTSTSSPTPVPDGPCDNPLIPLATGNQWRYRATTDSGEFFYILNTLGRNDGRNIVVVVEFIDETRGEIVQENVVCKNGAIDNFPLFLMDMHFSDYLDRLFDTYHEDGVYAHDHATLVAKNWQMDWQSQYLSEDRFFVKNPTSDSNLSVIENSPIQMSFQMDGSREDVAVPAGEFPQALKVAHSFSMIVTVTLPTGGSGGLLVLNTTQWYQPYVGLVRSEVDSAWVEVGGQQFSAPYHSLIELVEFTPGQ